MYTRFLVILLLLVSAGCSVVECRYPLAEPGEKTVFVWTRTIGGWGYQRTPENTHVTQHISFEGRADFWNAATATYFIGDTTVWSDSVTFSRGYSVLVLDTVYYFDFLRFPSTDSAWMLQQNDFIYQRNTEIVFGSAAADGIEHHYVMKEVTDPRITR